MTAIEVHTADHRPAFRLSVTPTTRGSFTGYEIPRDTWDAAVESRRVHARNMRVRLAACGTPLSFIVGRETILAWKEPLR